MDQLPNNKMSKRFQEAYLRMKEKDGEHIWRLHEQYRDFPDMARFVCEVYFDEIGSRQILDASTKEAVIISIFFAKGIYEDPMFSHMLKGIECGLTMDEIRELALLSMAYSGAPNATTNVRNAVLKLEEVLKKEQNISDDKEAYYPDLKGNSRQEFGESLFAEESGDLKETFVQKYRNFASLKEIYTGFVYADLKSRQILDEKKKQLSILAMLSAVSANEDLLSCQIMAAQNAGITFSELEEICLILAGYLGFPAAFSLASIVDQIFEG